MSLPPWQRQRAGVTHFTHRLYHLAVISISRTPASIRTHTPPPHHIQTHSKHGALGNLTPWRAGASIKWAGNLEQTGNAQTDGKQRYQGRWIYARAGHLFSATNVVFSLAILFFMRRSFGTGGGVDVGAFTTTDHLVSQIRFYAVQHWKIGREGGALGHFGFMILACCTS